jgi:hypothetical protein
MDSMAAAGEIENIYLGGDDGSVNGGQKWAVSARSGKLIGSVK